MQTLGVEYTFDLLSRFELPVDDMFKALDYTKICRISPSLHALGRSVVQAFK